MLDWNEYLKFFAGLLAIVNPIGAIPIFVSMTTHESLPGRHRIGRTTAVSVAVILCTTLVLGKPLLNLFGISIASFRVGGGLLILLMAISMMHARVSSIKQTEEEAKEAVDKQSIAVVPLGIPLLAGPGAISTVILYAHRANMPLHRVILGGEILVVALVVWLALRLAPMLSSLLGQTGINIATRIMGLIMAAIGVEFIANGLKILFPLLAGNG